MAVLHLYLEAIEGDWFGWIEHFPGAYTQGDDPEEAVQNAPHLCQDYVRWLAQHGEAIPDALCNLSPAHMEFRLAQVHWAEHPEMGREINGFFRMDEPPLTTEEIETALRLLHYSREDLHKAVHLLEPQTWDAAPFGGKSVNMLLRHIADKEREMLEALGVPTAALSAREPVDDCNVVRSALQETLCSIPAAARNKVSIANGEVWTWRKMVRRALWHERFHCQQIAVRSNPSQYLRSIVADTRLHDMRERIHSG